MIDKTKNWFFKIKFTNLRQTNKVKNRKGPNKYYEQNF